MAVLLRVGKGHCDPSSFDDQAALPEAGRYARPSDPRCLPQVSPRGFEPPTIGSGGRRLSSVTSVKSGTLCDVPQSEVPTMVPSPPGADTDADFRRLVAAWATLPDPIKTAIAALLHAADATVWSTAGKPRGWPRLLVNRGGAAVGGCRSSGCCLAGLLPTSSAQRLQATWATRCNSEWPSVPTRFLRLVA